MGIHGNNEAGMAANCNSFQKSGIQNSFYRFEIFCKVLSWIAKKYFPLKATNHENLLEFHRSEEALSRYFF